MKQYLELLENIIENGVEKESGRANMPNTVGLSRGFIEMNLADGFPLLTTKKMYWKGIVHELLWFLRGETNIKYLVDNNVNIWNGDAYRWYLKHCQDQGILRRATMEEFIQYIKEDRTPKYINEFEVPSNYKLGDLGKVYGYQWRNQNGVDQVKEVLDGLKSNPYSRYHIIDGWNKADFSEMALPPCHLLYQFIVRPLSFLERSDIANSMGVVDYGELLRIVGNEKIDSEYKRILNENNIPQFYLDLNMYQRSVDTALGCPYNIASMSLLLMLFAKASNMIAGVARWNGGDTHLYVNHIESAKQQITRTPYKLPTMNIIKELNSLDDILDLTINDFELINYESHPTINFELFVGLKK